MVDNRYGTHDSPEHTRVNVPAYYPSVTAEEMASPLDVAAGAEVRGIDIRLSRAPVYPVSGKLTGLPATFKRRVEVTLTGAGNAPGDTAEAAPSAYRFDLAVLQGQYVLKGNSGDGHFFATVSVRMGVCLNFRHTRNHRNTRVLGVRVHFDHPWQVLY